LALSIRSPYVIRFAFLGKALYPLRVIFCPTDDLTFAA
jgi:hypothetical protein